MKEEEVMSRSEAKLLKRRGKSAKQYRRIGLQLARQTIVSRKDVQLLSYRGYRMFF